MRKTIFSIPSEYKHVFVEHSQKSPSCPTYYTDKHLQNPIFDFSSCSIIRTMLPDNLSKIEVLNVGDLDLDGIVSHTIDKLSLWPYPHMVNAEVVIDGIVSSSFPLFSDNTRTRYREKMDQNMWEKSLLIVYQKRDGRKIGFLLFK